MIKPLQQSGFTLIELLVVIAIIGILSSVVLASLQDARSSAKDSAIKQQVRALATTFELIRNETGSYPSNTNGLGMITTAGVNACRSQNFISRSADQLKLCQAISDSVIVPDPVWGMTMYWGAPSTPPFFPWNDPVGGYDPDEYSFVVKLSSGDWYCHGSSGKSSVSSPVPYFGGWIYFPDMNQPGCPYNP